MNLQTHFVTSPVPRDTTPTLRAIQRVAYLSALGTGSTSAGERDVATGEAAKLSAQHRLTTGALRAYAPAGVTRRPDGVLMLRTGLLWWRSVLAVNVARFVGFNGPVPLVWSGGDGCDLELRLLGTSIAVDAARALYAAASVACTALASRAKAGKVDEYLLGVAMGMGEALVEAMQVRDRQLDAELRARGPLAVRPPDGDAVDMGALAQDVESELQRGVREARMRGTGKTALVERPKIAVMRTPLDMWIQDMSAPPRWATPRSTERTR